MKMHFRAKRSPDRLVKNGSNGKKVPQGVEKELTTTSSRTNRKTSGNNEEKMTTASPGVSTVEKCCARRRGNKVYVAEGGKKLPPPRGREFKTDSRIPKGRGLSGRMVIAVADRK